MQKLDELLKAAAQRVHTRHCELCLEGAPCAGYDLPDLHTAVYVVAETVSAAQEVPREVTRLHPVSRQELIELLKAWFFMFDVDEAVPPKLPDALHIRTACALTMEVLYPPT